MADVHTKATRSKNMAAVKSKDTKIEILVRKYLHSQGFRFRKHSPKLPGKPDISLKKYNTVILVNGCFFHAHQDNCPLFKWPSDNKEFWKKKLTENSARDQKKITQLQDIGWKVIVVWECDLKPKNVKRILSKLPSLIRSNM